MTSKRDVVLEILERKKRVHSRLDRWTQFSRRNDALIDAYDFARARNTPTVVKSELLRWIRVGTVAALEAYFRAVVRDLVDYGEPFRSRVRALYDAKLDLSTILSLNAAEVTMGELIAHLLPLSRLDDITQRMTTLLDGDFVRSVKSTVPEGYDEPLEAILPDFYPSLERLYKMRNVHAHEFGAKDGPKVREVFRELGAATYFAFVTEQILE